MNLIYDNNHYVKGKYFFGMKVLSKYYQPKIDLSQFWTLESEFKSEETCTAKPYKIDIEFDIYWIQYYVYQNALFPPKIENLIEQDPYKVDTIKSMLVSPNMCYFLVFIIGLNLLHIFLNLYSVKLEWEFWSNLVTYKGISLYSIVFEIIREAISIFYLIDQEANNILILSFCISFGTAAWKLFLNIHVIERADKCFPYFEFQRQPSYKNTTAVHDKHAAKIMMIYIMPIIFMMFLRKFNSEDDFSDLSYYSIILEV